MKDVHTKDENRNAQMGIENENGVFSNLQWHNKIQKKKSEEAAVFKREKYQREIQPVCVSQVSGNNRRQ